MGLSRQIFLLFTALVATSRCLPDELKTLPDASVFELKPPKEFQELFQPDDNKKLINPMKSPLTVAMTSHKLPDVPKLLPDPSVFEMKPPKEFSDLFQLKEKKNVSVVENKGNLISPKKESSDVESTSVTDLPKPAAVDIKQPKENLGSTVNESEKLVTPIKIANQLDKKNILDPKVFEMKPPKEFLDLFQSRDKDNVIAEKEKVIPIKIPSDKETSLFDEKPILNPSVFEMDPPKEFLDLFQLNRKESTSQTESSGAVVPNNSLPDEKKTLSNQNVLEVKPPSEFTNLFPFKEEAYKPMKWPSWSFNVNNFEEKGFSDWFYLPNVNAQESNKINKHTIKSQKPQSVHWNQQTFESHSHYHQSPLGDKEFKPFNMFATNVGVAGYQNVFSANEDGNDIQVRVTDKKKDKDDSAKITKSSVEENSDVLNKVAIPPSEKGVKTNKVSLIQPKEQELPPKTSVVDNSIVVPVPVQLMASPQNHQGVGNMVFMSTRYPSQYHEWPLINLQMPSQAYGFAYTNHPNNQIHLSPHSSEVKPEALPLGVKLDKDSASSINASKGFHDLLPQMQSEKPTDIIVSSINHKHSSKDSEPSSTHVAAMLLPSKNVPQASSIISGNNMVINNGDKLQNVDQSISGIPAPNAFNVPSGGESYQEGFTANIKPQTMDIDNIPMNPPNLGQPVNYPVFGSANMVSQSNNYPQNQQPVFMTVPYGSNRVPLNYISGYGAPLNGPLMNAQHTTGQGVMVSNPTMVNGYSQNNLYALVPITNDYYSPHPYFNNLPSNGYGNQGSGQVYNLVPATNNVLLTTKDEDDL